MRWVLMVAVGAAVLWMSSGRGFPQELFGYGILLLPPFLWLGPSAAALLLARGGGPQTRRTYRIGAAVAGLPLIAVEILSISDALRRYDGFCYPALDGGHPCSLFQRIWEAAFSTSGFALFGWLLLGVPASIFGAVSVFAAWWLTDNRAR